MLLGDSSRIDRFEEVLRYGAVASMKVLPGGSVVADRSSRVTRERIGALLDKLRPLADTIVVAAPPIADSTEAQFEAQLLCAAADRTVLVAAKGKSRAGDLTAAAEALAKAQAVSAGCRADRRVERRASVLATHPPRCGCRKPTRAHYHTREPTEFVARRKSVRTDSGLDRDR